MLGWNTCSWWSKYSHSFSWFSFKWWATLKAHWPGTFTLSWPWSCFKCWSWCSSSTLCSTDPIRFNKTTRNVWKKLRNKCLSLVPSASRRSSLNARPKCTKRKPTTDFRRPKWSLISPLGTWNLWSFFLDSTIHQKLKKMWAKTLRTKDQWGSTISKPIVILKATVKGHNSRP